jgi:hypothetical protein
MALLDPDRGKRRRALVRDKANRAARTLGDAAGTTWRDLSHRAAGVASEAKRIARGEVVADRVLAERVRSKIGRLVSHPGAIEVEASRGEVTLAGAVLKREVEGLLRGVRCVRGLTRLEDRLEAHERPDGVPALQGPAQPREPRFELFRENWSPTARLLAGLAGAWLAGMGARRRGVIGGGLVAVGAGLTLRAATNRPVTRLLGLEPSHRGIDTAEKATVPASPLLDPAKPEGRGEETAGESVIGESTVEPSAPPPKKRPGRRGSSRGPTLPGPGAEGIRLKEE